ncbi:GntR family transcriptional regulator [Propionibacteriaceae bacterium Y1923]
MMLRVDPSAAQPPYEQLKSQLVAQMTSGALPTGAKLPSVRRLAADLGIAPNTVARAYRELEHSGFVRTAGRNGTVVVASVTWAPTSPRRPPDWPRSSPAACRRWGSARARPWTTWPLPGAGSRAAPGPAPARPE